MPVSLTAPFKMNVSQYKIKKDTKTEATEIISDHCCINIFLLHVLVVPVDENVSSICLLRWRSISWLPARSTVVQHWAATSQSRLNDRELSMSSLRNDQMPPGGGDARVFSSSAFSLDTLASKHRMWASSLKGLSLYSSRSHSLNCEETVESHKNATFSRCMLSLSSFYVSLFNTSVPGSSPDTPVWPQTPGAAVGNQDWGLRRVAPPSQQPVLPASPSPSPSWCKLPPEWHCEKCLPDCEIKWIGRG